MSYIFIIFGRMTALEEIKELGKKTADSSRRRLRALSQEELDDRIYTQRDSLLEGLREFEAFYWYTVGVTRQGEKNWGVPDAMKAEVAAEIWRQVKLHFFSMRKRWQEVEKTGHRDIDDLVEYTCKALAELADRADAEYRSYAETAFLLRSPQTAKRVEAALEEARSGKLPAFGTVREAIESLRAK